MDEKKSLDNLTMDMFALYSNNPRIYTIPELTYYFVDKNTKPDRRRTLANALNRWIIKYNEEYLYEYIVFLYNIFPRQDFPYMNYYLDQKGLSQGMIKEIMSVVSSVIQNPDIQPIRTAEKIKGGWPSSYYNIEDSFIYTLMNTLIDRLSPLSSRELIELYLNYINNFITYLRKYNVNKIERALNLILLIGWRRHDFHPEILYDDSHSLRDSDIYYDYVSNWLGRKKDIDTVHRNYISNWYRRKKEIDDNLYVMPKVLTEIISEYETPFGFGHRRSRKRSVRKSR